MSNRWRITIDTSEITPSQLHLTLQAVGRLSRQLHSFEKSGFTVDYASYFVESTVDLNARKISADISHARSSAMTAYLLTKTLPEEYSIESLD